MNETKTTDLKKSKFSKICEIREKKNGYINPVLGKYCPTNACKRYSLMF